MSEPRSPLEEAARRSPDQPAIVSASGTLTYAECLARTRRTAALLMDAGLKPKDVLALRMQPGTDAVVFLLACFELGVTACPINPKQPDRPLRAALERIQAKLLVSELDEVPDLPVPIRRPTEMLPGRKATRRAHVKFRANRPGMLVFTSGSTGTPKAALLGQGAFWESARRSNRNIPLGTGKRWLLSLPLYHVSGLSILFRCIVAGACVVIPDREQPLHDAIAWYGATHASLVAAQLRWLLHSEPGRKALARLEAVLMGGSGMPAHLLEEAHKGGVPLHVSYGLTEMASQVATTPPRAPLDMLTRGAPILEPGTVRIADDGVIEVCGATRFAGYKDHDALETPFDEGGWFRTGDRGELTGDGLLIVHGRADNMFISGGENIQPEEIEMAIMALEGVERAAVVPVLDETYGARPLAFVHMRDASMRFPTDFASRLAADLPSFKLPIAFHPWPHDLAGPELKFNRPAFQKRAEEILAGPPDFL